MSSNTSSLCLLLVTLLGACHAVFYTKSTEVDYPRIGRRSFYTVGRGNNYPRIGRRDGVDDGPTAPLFPGEGGHSLGQVPRQAKRGFYTDTDTSYPRVGRAQAGDVPDLADNDDDNGSSESFLDATAVRAANSQTQGLRVPLALLFIAYDSDGDGQLSKSEFMKGMAQYRRRNPLC